MSYRSGVSLNIPVELSLIVDFPIIVPATIGGLTMVRECRGSPGNHSFTLASLLVTGEV
jgi:hypothetical protein